MRAGHGGAAEAVDEGGRAAALHVQAEPEVGAEGAKAKIQGAHIGVVRAQKEKVHALAHPNEDIKYAREIIGPAWLGMGRLRAHRGV